MLTLPVGLQLRKVGYLHVHVSHLCGWNDSATKLCVCTHDPECMHGTCNPVMLCCMLSNTRLMDSTNFTFMYMYISY